MRGRRTVCGAGGHTSVGGGKLNTIFWCVSETPRARDCRQSIFAGDAWNCVLAPCEVIELSIVVVFIFVIEIGQLLKVDLVAQNGTNSTKSFDKLIAFTRTVGHELECSTKVFVLLR